jgi:hypothetical protein
VKRKTRNSTANPPANVETFFKDKLPPDVRAYFVAKGLEGAKRSVKAREAKYTKEERSELARKAVAARWEKVRKKKK